MIFRSDCAKDDTIKVQKHKSVSVSGTREPGNLCLSAIENRDGRYLDKSLSVHLRLDT